MMVLPHRRKKAISLLLSLVLAFSLIFTSGVVAAAQTAEEAEVSEDCPASLMFLGEGLLGHIPNPDLDWHYEAPDTSISLWESFLVFLESLFPGLAWLWDGWFNEDSARLVPVIHQVSGAVLGFLPIIGDVADGITIVSGRDQITGECISRLNQSLLALGIGAAFVFWPVKPVRGAAKVVGKPLIKILSELPKPKSDMAFEVWNDVSGKVIRIINPNINRVARKYRKFRVIIGKGATPTAKLADELGFPDFTKSNYRDALIEFTGKSKDQVADFEAHHILPQEFADEFLAVDGIDNINDPRLLAWVEKGEHRGWSSDYNEAWRTFFTDNSNPTAEEILEQAHNLADEFGYDVLFEVAEDGLRGRLPWPFGR